MAPLMHPNIRAAPSPVAMAAGAPIPARTSFPATSAAISAVAICERSIPRPIITIAMPSARMPNTETLRNIAIALPKVAKRGSRIQKVSAATSAIVNTIASCDENHFRKRDRMEIAVPTARNEQETPRFGGLHGAAVSMCEVVFIVLQSRISTVCNGAAPRFPSHDRSRSTCNRPRAFRRHRPYIR